jgi:hypothetical protein
MDYSPSYGEFPGPYDLDLRLLSRGKSSDIACYLMLAPDAGEIPSRDDWADP